MLRLGVEARQGRTSLDGVEVAIDLLQQRMARAEAQRRDLGGQGEAGDAEVSGVRMRLIWLSARSTART